MALTSVLENSESLMTLAHNRDVIKVSSHDVMDLNHFSVEWKRAFLYTETYISVSR